MARCSSSSSSSSFFLSSLLPRPNPRAVAALLAAASLSLLSYLLAIYNTSPSTSISTTASTAACFPSSSSSSAAADPADAGLQLDFLPRHSAAAALPSVPDPDPDPDLPAAPPPLPFCAPNFTDYCPCHDPARERLFPTRHLQHRERHCPLPALRRCRVPRPPGYRAPPRWPESRDRAWFANVPSRRLSVAKADQNWVTLDGDWLLFPGGGTSFVGGARSYADQMAKLLPLKTGDIRTALDIGCGVASFGGHLLNYKVLTMSVAPRDVHEAQVQFALERGLPAMLGVLSIHRLPYPSRSFDMAHCARCLVPWTARAVGQMASI